MADICVFIETRDGRAINAGLELLTPARLLADRLGCALTALVLGDGAEGAAGEAALYGADRVVLADGPEYARADSCVFALCEYAKKYAPAAMLLGATTLGREIAPRAAARLGAGLTADCVALSAEDGRVIWTLPAYGGNLLASIVCEGDGPQMGTVRPGVFKKPERSTRAAPVIREDWRPPELSPRVRLLERLGGGETVDISAAEVIVCAGRGALAGNGLELVSELAEALGGVVGATRAVTDAGRLSPARLIGQTGRAVSPRLYIACGVSGASQHLAGISGAETIVAINRDRDAPIFSVADHRIAGDIRDVLPELIRGLK